jgi:hypothetical protein
MNQHARHEASAVEPVAGHPEAASGGRKKGTVGFWPAAIVVGGLVLNLIWIAGLGWLAFYAVLWAARG